MQSSKKDRVLSKKKEIKDEASTDLREQLLFDGENYYLLRSLNRGDIDNLNNGNGINPKTDNSVEYTVQDVIAQIKMRHKKTNLISMSEDPNIVLTYDKSNLHRFVLIKFSKEEIENSNKVFSAGEYLLGIMDSEIERIATNAPENVRKILDNVDKATSIEEIVRIINDADRQVPTSLVEAEQKYLSNSEQLNQSKKIAKCKVLKYYGLMRGITHDERGKLLDISEFTRIMRNGYSSSEWLYSGKVSQDRIINIPQILIDSLTLLKQAEFQGKDKQILRKIEQKVLKLAISGEKINQHKYILEYSAHNDLKNDLTIDRAYEITNGHISYRDTNMQQIAIRSLAEMTLNKRKIIELLKRKLHNIDVEGLLSDTYCINQEMVTKQNNRGSQIGRNISFLITDYGYDLNETISMRLLKSVEELSDEQLKDIVFKGVNSKELRKLLITTGDTGISIETVKDNRLKYTANAIIEGYNWRKDGISLTANEKKNLMTVLLRGLSESIGLYNLMEAINKIQIGNYKFTQNDVFAIIINIAINGKIGNIKYRALLETDTREMQFLLLDNKNELLTTVLPISIDLLIKRGRRINKLKEELISLGVKSTFLDLKDIKNIYMTKKIVEEYIFNREISVEEKKSLIISILSNSNLGGERPCYLVTLIQRMEMIGLNKQEIYGMIINLGVNGKVLEGGYYYNSFLQNTGNICAKIAQYVDKIQTNVTDRTIKKAVIMNKEEYNIVLTETDKKKLKQELEELGIEKEFIELKNIKNIYWAKRIVEEYKFENEITSSEKAALIRAVLNNTRLGGENTCYLVTLIQRMEMIGLNKQEIYGMIINLGVNGKVLEGRYSYTAFLDNTRNICVRIALYLDKVQTRVTDETIKKAVINNKVEYNVALTETDEKKLKLELEELGIEKEFLESKNIKNIYWAKKIVEEYKFEDEITSNEKAALIRAVLNNSYLGGENSFYLFILIQRMEMIGLNKQEIYGMIINLGVNQSVLKIQGFSYTYLLSNLNNVCKTIAQYKDKIQTNVTDETIKKAVINNKVEYNVALTETDEKKLKQELEELGIEKEFIESKNIKNIYWAKRIVEEYKFENEITSSEKSALIRAVLNNSNLGGERPCYLVSLIQRMEMIGLNKQKIYGMIINLGVNGEVLEGEFYYSTFLHNTENICAKIAQYVDKIQTNVTNRTIKKAVIMNKEEYNIVLTETDKKKLKQELEELGIEKEFIELKNIKNIYWAKRIVEEYKFEDEITSNEKAALIRAVLNNSYLGGKNPCYLVSLIQRMEMIGLNKQEIYGMIINLSIGEKVLNQNGYSYSRLLQNTNNVCETIAKYKDQIKTNVTGEIIKKAKYNLEQTKSDNKQLQLELEKLGIEKDFLNSKDEKNVYWANKIVDEYIFKRKITSEEKTSLIRAILNNSLLNCKTFKYLETLIQRMEKIGLKKQQIYGMIINLGVNGKVLEQSGYSYAALLKNSRNSCESIAKYIDNILTEVTDETIKKAVVMNKEEYKANCTKDEMERLQQELEALGIEKDFIESKNIENVYWAKKVVDEYEFNRELTTMEKGALIKSILNSSRLSSNTTGLLKVLIQKMELIGLTRRERFGMIINLGVNGKVLEQSGYSYAALLNNTNNACETIVQYRDQIDTQVKEITIKKALKINNRDRKIKGEDLAKATLGLTVVGSGGSEICACVEADYMEQLKKNQAKLIKESE